jgi:hypothetical protein
MAWSPPTDTEIEVDKPIKAADIRRIRDLVQSMADADAGAPITGLTELSTRITISNDASAEFVLDNARYTSYMFVLKGVVPVTNSTDLRIRFSIDGGSTFITTSTYYIATTGTAFIQAFSNTSSSSALGGLSGALFLSVEGVPNISGKLVGANGATSLDIKEVGGVNTTSTTVDAIQFYMESGNLNTGVISAYGIK